MSASMIADVGLMSSERNVGAWTWSPSAARISLVNSPMRVTIVRRGDQGERDLAARFGLERAGAPARAGVRAAERLARVAARAVVLASEEARHPLLGERARVGRGRVALEERQRDRAVDLGEPVGGAGPEGLQLRARLVREGDPLVDEILAGARERPQRLGLIAVGHEHREAMAVGARERGEHERVEAVALATGHGEPRPHRGDLAGWIAMTERP
jgi:hypothetical protein